MSTKISAALTKELASKPHTNVLVALQADTAPVLEALNAREFPTRQDRVNAVSTSLREHAEREQKQILDYLKTVPGIEFESMWINNQIFVKKATRELVDWLAARDDVKAVKEDGKIVLDDPINPTD